MSQPAASRPIVVGIDGSKHAMRAALWAIDEAVSRDTPLLLVYVFGPDVRDRDSEYSTASRAIHRAWKAVEATEKPVKLESNILEGHPVTMLVELSRSAEMVCVGARGMGGSEGHERGTTAARLALTAFSPVAIVRRRHTNKTTPAGSWIVAALEASPGPHTVLQTAFEEAVLREAPILALTPWATAGPKSEDHEDIRATLDRFRSEARDDDVNVQISALPISDHISNLLQQSADIDQLVIIGPDNPGLVAEVVAPEMREVLRHTDCSVLVLRHRPE
jgi:nucleotide-binding universal stress UspA family protein